MNTNYYSPSQGAMVISPQGSQRYPDQLDAYSSIATQIYVSYANDGIKYAIDSCWETGNIYYANYDEGYVKKIKYDETEIARISLDSPSMVSAIQYSNAMSITVDYPPQEDLGCWIYDGGSSRIIKTDNNLQEVGSIEAMDGIACVMSDIDGGCYAVQQKPGSSSFIKINSNLQVVCRKYYSDFSPSISSFTDMAIDVNGKIWFCANKLIYNLSLNGSQIDQNFYIDPFHPSGDISTSTSSLSLLSDSGLSESTSSTMSSSVSTTEQEFQIGGIDVDRNSDFQYLYVVGGSEYKAFAIKYDQNGSLRKKSEYSNIMFPYIIKVVQGYGSNSFYILEDSAKWQHYSPLSSSSSSSSYIINWSSSSSSSTSTSSSSSSSSSYIENWSSSSSSLLGCDSGYIALGLHWNGLFTVDGYYGGYPYYICNTLLVPLPIPAYLWRHSSGHWILSDWLGSFNAPYAYSINIVSCPFDTFYDHTFGEAFEVKPANMSSSSSSVSDNSSSEETSLSSYGITSISSSSSSSSSSSQALCGVCTGMQENYYITFSGLGGPFAVLNGNTYTYTWDSACHWDGGSPGGITNSDLWFGSPYGLLNWVIRLSLGIQCEIVLSGGVDQCDPTSNAFSFNSIESNCHGCLRSSSSSEESSANCFGSDFAQAIVSITP